MHNARIDPDKCHDYAALAKNNGKPAEIRAMPEMIKGGGAICLAGAFFKPRL
ncbi:MAG: hypothetical protein LBU32_11540 [Clostridiales bacterium]|nr:hypothetical protein [Clostridiales bacterium]